MASELHIAVVALDEQATHSLQAALSEQEPSAKLDIFSDLKKAEAAMTANNTEFSACVLHTNDHIDPALQFYNDILSNSGIATLFLCGPTPREKVLHALSSGIDELIEKDREGRYLDFLPHSLRRILEHKREAQARAEAEAALSSIAEALSQASGKEFFRQLTLRLSEALHVDYALVGEIRGMRRKKVRTLAASDRGVTQANFEYLAADRPSEDIIEGRPCIIASGLRDKFPKDGYLQDMKMESYAGVPLHDNRGEIRGILSILDRKPLKNSETVLAALKLFAARAEIEMERVRIQEAMEIQARMLDQIGLAIICTETDGQIKSWNQHAAELLGFSRSEILGKSIESVLPGMSPEKLSANVLEPLLIKGHLSVETNMRKQDDSEFEAAITFSLEKSPKEEITGIIACCRDITERRQAVRKQHEAQQRLSLHLKHTSLAFIEWDMDAKVTAWNEAAERMYGYTAEEIIGQPASTIILPSFYQECEEIFKQLMARKGGERSTNENVRKDGKVITCEWHNTALLNEKGEVVGVASLVDDISERIAYEKKLRESEQAAARANRSKDEFLAVMSHEIRTPMNSIIGFADLLLETQVDESQRDNLEIIKSNAYQLLDLINNVLNFSRLDSGHVILEKRDLDLPALLFEVEESMSAEARQKGLDFRTVCDPILPRYIHTGYLELRQVLLSLVGNAIKFTQKGSVELTVTGNHVSTSESPGQWELTFAVKDTGIGIASEHLERIFSSFSQVDSSSTRRYGGTGLGLAICRRICELLGGRVWAQSEPGKGSTFFVELNAGAVPNRGRSQPPIQMALEPDNLSEYAEAYPSRILITDDEEDTCRLLGDMLREMGYDPDIARGGLECIEALQNNSYDLIFMDVAMPDIDGIEATQLIREGQGGEKHEDIFICAITAYDEGDDRQRCLDAGMNDHLGKPLLTKSLVNILRKASLHKARSD